MIFASFSFWKKVFNLLGHLDRVSSLSFSCEGSNSVFDPTLIAELGQVPQVFGIVQPVGEKYRSLTMLIVNIYNCCHLKYF